MQKPFRSLVLAAAFSLAVVPGVIAEQAGCNPHPPPIKPCVVAPANLQIVAYTVSILLGL